MIYGRFWSMNEFLILSSIHWTWTKASSCSNVVIGFRDIRILLPKITHLTWRLYFFQRFFSNQNLVNEESILKIVCPKEKRWCSMDTVHIKKEILYNFIPKVLIASFCFTTQNSNVQSIRTQDALLLRMWVPHLAMHFLSERTYPKMYLSICARIVVLHQLYSFLSALHFAFGDILIKAHIIGL